MKIFNCKLVALSYASTSLLKNFLCTVCIFLIGCLTVSVFSPDTHSFLFHGGDHCPHGKNGKPCASHQDEPSDDQGSSCAVILFGESSEHFFTLSNFSYSVLLDLGVSKHDSNKKYFLGYITSSLARGPPELI